MTADAVRALWLRHRLIGVVRADSADEAVALARAAVAGGLGLIEVTLTTPGALEAIRTLVADGIAVGVGTVLTPAQARHALFVGASFVVSPHTDPAIVHAVRDRGGHVTTGAVTPTEVACALKLGVDAIKVFPASSYGGPAHLRALRDPFPGAPFIPTGGVDASNLAAYLDSGAVAVGASTALFPREGRDLAEVTRRARELVDRVQAWQGRAVAVAGA